MPHLLAVDWDQSQARYVLATLSGRKVRVRALGAHEFLVDLEAGNAAEADESFGRWISSVLKKHKVRRCRLLVGLPRSSVEMLELSLPPAADRELPELVSNQALQASSTIAEDTVLDFWAAPAGPGEPRRATVAALSAEELQRARRRCAAAGKKPQRLVLRPLASISLFRRLAMPRQPSLVVNRVGHEVDLNVVQQNRLVLSRTVRLPEDASPEDVAERLLLEITRTLLAAPREQLGGASVQNVYVIGSRRDYAPLVDELEQQLSLTAEVLDPFTATNVVEALIPPHRERFAPLLGMLLDEAISAHPIDFLHPRRPPKQTSPWRRAAVAAGLAAAAALAVALYVGSQLSEIEQQNAQLRGRLRELNETARKAVQQKQRIEAIAAWKGRDVNWLDELRDISVRFPGPRDAVVQRLTMRPAQSRGGMIDLQGLVRDPNIVVNMEQQIRDPLRTVRSRRIQQRALEDDYTWLFETSVSVRPRKPEQYVARPPESPAAATASSVPKPAGPEPVGPDPAVADPAVADPAVADPAGPDPAGPEPAPAKPALAEATQPLAAAASSPGPQETSP